MESANPTCDGCDVLFGEQKNVQAKPRLEGAFRDALLRVAAKHSGVSWDEKRIAVGDLTQYMPPCCMEPRGRDRVSVPPQREEGMRSNIGAAAVRSSSWRSIVK